MEPRAGQYDDSSVAPPYGPWAVGFRAPTGPPARPVPYRPVSAPQTPSHRRPPRIPPRHRLGLRIAGVPLRVHWSFVFLALFVLLVFGGRGAGALLAGAVWVGAIFAAVVVHELGHCLVIRRRGGEVRDILLLPLGGMTRAVRLPDRPPDELAVSLAGPATSFVLAALAAVGAAAAGARLWPPTMAAGSWWARLAWLNVVLGLFNLLPAFPLDGGRVLRALLSMRLGRVRGTITATRLSRGLAVAMMLFGFLWDFWFILIGVFVYLGASAEDASLEANAVAGERDEHPAHRTQGPDEHEASTHGGPQPPQASLSPPPFERAR